MKRLKILMIILASLFITYFKSFAQESINFEELKDTYLKDKKYTELVDYLKSIAAKNKAQEPEASYYVALTRYQQLKYLEETQNWDEYFSKGNTYRDEITAGAQKAIDLTKVSDAQNIRARLLLWQFHKDQQDTLAENALSDLVNAVSEYSLHAQDIKPIKEVADKLLSYQEKGKSKELYKIYVDKIIASDIKDEQLKDIAFGFYKEGSLEASQAVYDAYIDRIIKSLPKEKVLPVLAYVAKLFAYKNTGAYDTAYAEKIFKRLEAFGGKEAFNENLIYLRAFNLEKAKEYLSAKDMYINLSQAYPQSVRLDEANYKVGLIFTYLLRDTKSGREYFEKLSQKEISSPQVISSLYQLGLLSQWGNDLAKAKDYYNKLIEKAKDGFSETVALAKSRLKEIDEMKPIDYNLKMFLDASLNEGNAANMSTNLSASIYILKQNEEVNIISNANMPISGCMPVELQYLWSGDIGRAKIAPEGLASSPSFVTSYADTGTKEVNLVVLSPSGIVDRAFDLLDVY